MRKLTEVCGRAADTLRAAGLPAGARVVCAVSGGPDSVAMLNILREIAPRLGIEVVGACHFEHGIRGEDSLADMRFVAGLCSELKVPLMLGRGDIPALAAARGVGFETAARDERRAFYLRALAAFGATHCALGHHADDQAETVLMHLLRGAHAAIGMRAVQGHLIRPLLAVRRREIEEVLEELGAAYRTDATNLVDDNPRNALRPLLDRLGALYPGGALALSRAADFAREDDDYLGALADAWLEGHLRGDALTLDGLPDRPVLRRALCKYARMLGGAQVGSAAVKRLMELPGARVGARLRTGEIFLERTEIGLVPVREGGEDAPAVPLAVPGVTECAALGGRFRVEIADAADGFGTAEGAFQLFDMDRLPPLRVRGRRTGDSMRPFGAPGHKPLKDVLIDKKVPRAARDALPLLACGREIWWAVGVARGNGASVQPDTRRIVRVTWERAETDPS